MNPATLTPTKISIIVLALITGVIHLLLGIGMPLLLLNGLGYVVLTADYILRPNFLKAVQGYVGWVFIAYTAITVVLYFVFNWPDVWNTGGIFTKVVEVLLIAQLLRDR